MSHDQRAIARRLRGAGFRVTPQRQQILDAVCELGGHVTPEAVYSYLREHSPEMSIATVYRTLHFLREQRIVTAAQASDGRTGYELAGNAPHHHLVCRTCGGSSDLSHAALVDLARQVKINHGFAIEMDHISFFGRCAGCHSEVVSE